MFQHLKFAVRYWSSLLPEGFTPPDTGPAWVDYSLHPASKLGLHNALLAVHDRREILEADGGYYDCAVFLVGDGRNEQLSPEMAEKLFAALPHGRIKWLEVHHADSAAGPATTVHASIDAEGGGAQLPLFQHLHTPYDDQEEKPHRFDLDV
jgi:hypothetical protein